MMIASFRFCGISGLPAPSKFANVSSCVKTPIVSPYSTKSHSKLRLLGLDTRLALDARISPLTLSFV